ncbi:MAG: hypothetical protein ACP5F3_04090 [Candidatus Syntrophosphaera sp.]
MNLEKRESPRLMTWEEGMAFKREVLAKKYWFDSINLAAGTYNGDEAEYLIIISVI